ncbi:MAG: hypothetical protein H7843_10175 [Nitrospirota bacterium]
MAIRLVITEELISDLKTFIDLDDKDVQLIVSGLSLLEPLPIVPSVLQAKIESVFHSQPEKSTSTYRLLMSLCNTSIKADVSEEGLFESLLNSIEEAGELLSKDEVAKLKDKAPTIQKLISLPAIWNVVKGLDLSTDYVNLFQSARINTDIRPLFNKGADEIQGAIISHTMRLTFDTVEGMKSLSIAMDDRDIVKLSKQCERAITKAMTAKNFMQKSNIQSTIINGER